MVNEQDAANAALKRVLDEINSAMGDFRERPAKAATDVSVSGDTPLHKIAIWGDIESAEVLLRSGANVNAPGEDDDLPLHRAIAGGHIDMIRYLLLHGARSDIPNRYGTTPLSEAELTGDASIKAAFGPRTTEN